jgi:ribosomal protein S18 acetylase RimI-like enzyme
VDIRRFDWNALSELYRIAPLGDKKPEDVKRAFGNSMYKCFAFDEAILAGAGRDVADGVDCSYIYDIAVHPRSQGRGLGKEIAARLRDFSRGHTKIVLYADPGTEPFYEKLGFRHMLTAMAIFGDEDAAIK